MDQSSSSASSVDDSQQLAGSRRSAGAREKSKRPQLSCKNCRARKVKVCCFLSGQLKLCVAANLQMQCDRIQPCSACSFHQSANACEYELTEGERQPILQAEIIREQKKEIERLKGELAAVNANQQNLVGSNNANGRQRKGPSELHSHVQASLSQFDQSMGGSSMNIDRFIGAAKDVSLYTQNTWYKLIFRYADMNGWYKHIYDHSTELGTNFAQQTTNPLLLPVIWPACSGTTALLNILPSSGSEMEAYLDSFNHISVGFSFPYLPTMCSKENVEKYFARLDYNSDSYPDILALIFATIGQGLFYGSFDRFAGKWTPETMYQETQKADAFMAAAFQALRLSSFLSKPNLRTVETLTMILQYLSDSGRTVDAWTLLGLTVRLAVWAKPCIEDHDFQEPPAHRISLWWWLLYLDGSFSMMHGRPLAASRPGDCSLTELTNSESPIGSNSSMRFHITKTCRSILEYKRIDQFTISSFTAQLLDLSHMVSLDALFSTSNNYRDNSPLSWPTISQQIASHMFIHSLIILINQQSKSESVATSGIGQGEVSSYSRILESCRSILHAFELIRLRVRPALLTWSNCQAAFNAAVVLTRSISETSQTHDLPLIKQTRDIFHEVHSLGLHSKAESAASQIQDLCQIAQSGSPILGKVLSTQGMAVVEGLDGQDSIMNFRDIFPESCNDSGHLASENSPIAQTFTAVIPSNQGKPNKKARTVQSLSSGSSGKYTSKRMARKDKEHGKSRSNCPWPSGDSPSRIQAGRPWSVSRKQHQLGLRPASIQPKSKPRISGTGSSQQLMSATAQPEIQGTQYLSADVLGSFPAPPSSQQQQHQQRQEEEERSTWNDLTNQLMSASQAESIQLQSISIMQRSREGPGQVEGQGQSTQSSSSTVMQTGTSSILGVIRPQTHKQRQQQRQQSKQLRASQSHDTRINQLQEQQHQGNDVIAAQHIFTSDNGGAFAQPQSPALWGFPLMNQEYTATPATPVEGTDQPGGAAAAVAIGGDTGQQQTMQHPMFPGGMSDPNSFWEFNDAEHYWGG